MGLPIRVLRTTHHEAMDWRSRVIANGGTVDGATMSAVSRFCRRIDGIGIRDRFWRLNMLCGDQLEAALVPLYRAESFTATVRGNTTDTNVNFVSGDYNNTGASSGLKGNGSTKHLGTGLLANSLTATDAHFGVGLRAADSSLSSFRTLIGTWTGALDTNANSMEIAAHSGLSSARAAFFSRFNVSTDRFGDNIGATPGPLAAGDIVAAWPTMYRNGLATGADATTSANYPSAHQLSVLAIRNNSNNTMTNHSSARISWYSIGRTMTAAQVLAFYGALAEFNSSLSRT